MAWTWAGALKADTLPGGAPLAAAPVRDRRVSGDAGGLGPAHDISASGAKRGQARVGGRPGGGQPPLPSSTPCYRTSVF